MFKFSTYYRLAIVAALLATASTAGSAASYYISPSGNDANPGTLAAPLKTIGAGINKCKAGDIVILGDGTYTGPGNVDLSISTQITVESRNGASKSIIDCAAGSANQHRAFVISSAGTSVAPVVIAGITIQNGYTGNGGGVSSILKSVAGLTGCTFYNDSGEPGGALYIDNVSNVGIQNCSFSFNSAPGTFGGGNGGSIYSAGVVTASNCTLANDTANQNGGALYNDHGNFTFQNSTISYETAGSDSGYGGAIYSDASFGGSTLTLTACTLVNNTAYVDGGAVYLYGGASNATLDTCTLTQNIAYAAGGAIYLNGGTSNVVLNKCFITGNTAQSQDGGGVVQNAQSGSTLKLDNSVIYGNSGANGGGIIDDGGTLSVLFSSISGNAATGSGGGIYLASGCSATLIDNIVWNDSASGTNAVAEIDNHSTTASVRYTDVQNGFAGVGNINANPLFVSALKQNLTIHSNSPCVGIGTSIPGITLDITGRNRANPPSMGAYEGGAHWTAAGSAMGSDGSLRLIWNDGDGDVGLWTISSTGTHTNTALRPGVGYSGVLVAVGPDNHAYVLMQGQAGSAYGLWNVAPTGAFTGHGYPYSAGWVPNSMSVGPDSHVHIMWTNISGQIVIWNISASGTFTGSTYGPY